MIFVHHNKIIFSEEFNCVKGLKWVWKYIKSRTELERVEQVSNTVHGDLIKKI